ncbi:MAG: hypothetical protein GY953_24295, partial [bacterium]|nr:hypothetical protein [bacterium]
FYRFVMIYDEDVKLNFERVCVYMNKFENLIPLPFLLGFYVTQVMNRSVKNVLLIGSLLTLGSTATAEPPKPSITQPETAMVVRVYDFAGVQEDVLERAEMIAGQIFQHAGIEMDWTGCPTSVEERDQYPDCLGPIGPRDLILRILPAVNQEFAKQKHVFGAAALPGNGGFGVVANIYYDRVEQITWTQLRGATESIFASQLSPELCTSVTLGMVMAHEMGHLLLGTHSHSNNGIMRPHWDRAAMEDAFFGRQQFTSRQVKKLRADVRARSQAVPGS